MPGPGGLLSMAEEQPQQQQEMFHFGAQPGPPMWTSGGMGPGGNGAPPAFAPPPELAGYFDSFGNPRIDDPRTVASQAGIGLGQLASSFAPQNYSNQNVQYNVPSDRGGFFSVQDLFGLSGTPRAVTPGHGMQGPVGLGQGQVIREGAVGLPKIFESGANLPSTNNWRLLPEPYNRPGYIMRNGNLISLDEALQSRGGWGGWRGNYGNSAEQFIPGGVGIGLGTGALYGSPGLFANSGASLAGWPGSLTPWRPVHPGMQG